MRRVALMLLVSLLAGCDRIPSATTTQAAPVVQMLPTVQVELAGRRFTLEVADDLDEMQRGLMYRQSMPRDRGMIFVYDREQILTFYMKNTYIPLDIIFLDSKGKVVSIKQMKPLDLTSTSSDRPARFAIELNEGVARELGLKSGDVVVLPDFTP